ENLLIRTVAQDGECFVLQHEGFNNPHAYALEAIDAALVDHELIRSARDGENAIELGIERDPLGRRVAYWLKPTPTDRVRRRIDASRMLHIYVPEFLQPVYEARLRSALFVGAITGVPAQSPTPDMYAVKWRPRGWAWVDPLKDTNASILAINNALASREEVIAETGGDFEEVLEQL